MKFENTQDARNVVRDALKEGVVSITFTKKNGDTRVIDGTTSREFLIEKDMPKSTDVISKEYQAAFDVSIGGWRSFRWDSVTNISIL